VLSIWVITNIGVSAAAIGIARTAVLDNFRRLAIQRASGR
jgi:hypothetical protein